MIADLVQAVRSEGGQTACDRGCALRATEIAFGVHASSDRDGTRTELPLAAELRGLTVESFPWGNQDAEHRDVLQGTNANDPWAE